MSTRHGSWFDPAICNADSAEDWPLLSLALSPALCPVPRSQFHASVVGFPGSEGWLGRMRLREKSHPAIAPNVWPSTSHEGRSRMPFNIVGAISSNDSVIGPFSPSPAPALLILL